MEDCFGSIYGQGRKWCISLPPTFHLLELTGSYHGSISNCKGVWEIDSNCVPRKKKQVWNLDAWGKDAWSRPRCG